MIWRSEPTARIVFTVGSWWHEDPADPAFVGPLGFVPRPTSRWGWFRHHVLLGLLNGIPLRACVAFAWRNSTHRPEEPT